MASDVAWCEESKHRPAPGFKNLSLSQSSKRSAKHWWPVSYADWYWMTDASWLCMQSYLFE